MNDRLQIAAMCLQGLLSRVEIYPKEAAKSALDYADALLAECGEATNEHQNYSALPKSPYTRPHVSGSATTQPRKVEDDEARRMLHFVLTQRQIDNIVFRYAVTFGWLDYNGNPTAKLKGDDA